MLLRPRLLEALSVGALLTAVVACGDDDGADDAGQRDAGRRDAGHRDAGPRDAGRDAASDGGELGSDGGAVGVLRVWVGRPDGGLVVYELDEATGALAELSRVSLASIASFAALAPDGRTAFVVDEGSDQVFMLAVEAGTGALSQLSIGSSGGGGPAHVAADRTGSWVFAANYGGGSVAVLPVIDGVRLGEAVDVVRPGDNAHAVVVDATNRFVFVPCLGSDRVAQFRFDSATGALTPNVPAAYPTAGGAGPRHLAMHPAGDRAYLINELDSTVSTLSVSSDGLLSELQTISTLPAGASGPNTTAEIVVHPSGRFVYGSNRGHDSIAVWRVADGDRTLSLVEHESTMGSTPRSFAVTPDGAHLIVGNQRSDSVVTFSIDLSSGELTHRRTLDTDAAPYYVGAFTIPTD